MILLTFFILLLFVFNCVRRECFCFFRKSLDFSPFEIYCLIRKRLSMKNFFVTMDDATCGSEVIVSYHSHSLQKYEKSVYCGFIAFSLCRCDLFYALASFNSCYLLLSTRIKFLTIITLALDNTEFCGASTRVLRNRLF